MKIKFSLWSWTKLKNVSIHIKCYLKSGRKEQDVRRNSGWKKTTTWIMLLFLFRRRITFRIVYMYALFRDK